MNSPCLVLGAAGPIGRAGLPMLRARGVEIIAVSRAARVERDDEGTRWLRGDLFADLPAIAATSVISLGPLDGLVAWLERAAPTSVRRVVALSSTSARVKEHSIDAEERALAARLRDGEQRLAAWCVARDVAWTVLRPTMIYGGGGDRNLSRLAALARRFGHLPLPRGARGRRQPVHAADVARACVDVLDEPRTHGNIYDLPGGETLHYDDMVARLLAALPGRPRLWRLPDAVFRLAATLARVIGARRDIGDAAIARLAQDLVFDAEPARRDFGYAPRGFDAVSAVSGDAAP